MLLLAALPADRRRDFVHATILPRLDSHTVSTLARALPADAARALAALLAAVEDWR